MGIWINEPMFRDPEHVERAVDTLAESGYGIVRLFLRNSNFTHRSPEFIAVVARAVERAHARGLRAVLDCEPHLIVGGDMGRQYPDAMGCKLVRVSSPVIDGHWLLRVDAPRAVGADPIFDGVEAAYLQHGGETRETTLDFDVRRETHFYRNGDIHRELVYREGTQMSHRRTIELRGTLPDVKSGELLAYVRFSARTLADFWSEGFKLYFDDLLERYRSIPLDGVGWDEPAIDGDWSSYRYGTAFATAFEQLNGYKLSDKLHLLDAGGMSGEAAKTRLDYYRTLNEGLARSQANLNAKARELWGQDLIYGTHHTWQGEGGINDYRAGAVDYFRLNDNMDAGYTDCSWWDQASVAYAYTLASSLGRLTPSGEADVNTWHFKPTVANTRRNVNLMTLMNIDWFNIWFGSDSDCIMQEGHYTWPETVKRMQAHRKLQLAIGRRKPVVDVAVWHGWEGVCGWNRAGLANVQKAFCLNTSELFIKRGIAADFVDSRLLAESRIEGGRLVNRLGAYRTLIVPYALAMPRKAFDACVAFARSGGRLVFVGTPVAFDEDGTSLTADFARLLDMPEMTAEQYLRGLDVECAMPPFRPQQLEVCRQLPTDLPRALRSCEGEVHGVASPGGNTVFLTDLDPGQRLVDQLAQEGEKTLRVHGDNILWRLYRGDSDDSLVVVSADERPLRGVVIWGGAAIEIDGGSAGLFTHDSAGKLVLTEGDLSWRTLECHKWNK
ncbi:MAG: hypothetical protein HY770_04630 [Chitinivibrionia bacterium]|nr:hypothetical protein [Chitinivibrionia bacterium]